MSLVQLAERRWIPDGVIRYGIRRLLRTRLATEQRSISGDVTANVDQFANRLRQSAVTIEAHRANEQHYEVPSEFFELVLGRHLKYSCGLWSQADQSLDTAEEAMLQLTCERAAVGDGMEILDLGCGWGSLSLWIAEQYPGCRITSLSNSATQREYIMRRCQQRGFSNVDVITADVATFDTDRRYDRVITVEMLEHVRNYERLFSRVARWLQAGGQMFAHIFCHRRYAYAFETDGAHDWMGRHFFSGGIMPSVDLFRRFQRDLSVRDQWWVDGTHYARTCEAWLAKLDANQSAIRRLFNHSPDSSASTVQLQRWRMFFMACAELFAYNRGNEWGVGHYVLRPTDS